MFRYLLFDSGAAACVPGLQASRLSEAHQETAVMNSNQRICQNAEITSEGALGAATPPSETMDKIDALLQRLEVTGIQTDADLHDAHDAICYFFAVTPSGICPPLIERRWNLIEHHLNNARQSGQSFNCQHEIEECRSTGSFCLFCDALLPEPPQADLDDVDNDLFDFTDDELMESDGELADDSDPNAR